MNIDRIISESIDSVIVEGYSGKYAEDWVSRKVMPKATRWLKAVKANKPDVDRRFQTFVYTNGYGFDEKPSMMMRGKNLFLVQIVICYFPDRNFVDGIGGATEHPIIDGKNIKILLNVNNTCEPLAMYKVLIHEFTHVIDIIIGRRNGNPFHYGYVHQKYLFENYSLPNYITWVLYHLWDTSEFNAKQVDYKSDPDTFNRNFEILMNCITKANNTDDEKLWEEVKRYLYERFNMFFKFKTTAWIKKYFINTSFKLLKKFTKKVEI